MTSKRRHAKSRKLLPFKANDYQGLQYSKRQEISRFSSLDIHPALLITCQSQILEHSIQIERRKLFNLKMVLEFTFSNHQEYNVVITKVFFNFQNQQDFLLSYFLKNNNVFPKLIELFL